MNLFGNSPSFSFFNTSPSLQLYDMMGLSYVGREIPDRLSEDSEEDIDISESRLRTFHDHGITTREANVITKIIESNAALWKELGFEKKYIRKQEKEFRRLPRSLFYVVASGKIKVYIQCKKHNIPIIGSGFDMVYTKSLEFFSAQTCVTSSMTLADSMNGLGIIRTAESKKRLSQKLKRVFGLLNGQEHIVKLMHTHDYMSKRGIPKVGFWFEYCEERDLEKWWKNGKTLSKVDRHQILSDVILGVLELHNHRLCHYDIKAANVLLYRSKNGELRAKLGDLGFTASPDGFGGSGTPLHMAPEIWAVLLEKGEGKYKKLDGYKIDIWALGELFWECLYGDYFISKKKYNDMKALEKRDSFLALRKEFLEREYPPVPEGSDSIEKLTIEMIQKDPHLRPRSVNVIYTRFSHLKPLSEPGENMVWQLRKRFELNSQADT